MSDQAPDGILGIQSNVVGTDSLTQAGVDALTADFRDTIRDVNGASCAQATVTGSTSLLIPAMRENIETSTEIEHTQS